MERIQSCGFLRIFTYTLISYFRLGQVRLLKGKSSALQGQKIGTARAKNTRKATVKIRKNATQNSCLDPTIFFSQNQIFTNDEDIPSEFLCPITHEIMDNPVALADGFVYDEMAIKVCYFLSFGFSKHTRA